MPTLDEVVKVIAEQTGLEGPFLAARSSLTDAGLTSFAMMRLLVHLEDHFECELSPADLAEVFTMPLDELCKAIERSSPEMS